MYTLYLIRCSVNGKGYVGYTSKTAQHRFAAHKDNARWGRKAALYDAIRAYGPDVFSVIELLTCETHAEACAHEVCLVRTEGTLLPTGYNMTRGGDGVPLTPEQHAAVGEAKRGKFSAAQREAADRRVGSKASAETKAKLSAQRKGRKKSPESVAKRTAALRTPEAREAASRRAKEWWDAVRRGDATPRRAPSRKREVTL